MNKSIIVIVALILLGIMVFLISSNNDEANENSDAETSETDTTNNESTSDTNPIEADGGDGTGASASVNTVALKPTETGNFVSVDATLIEPGFVVIYRVNSNSETKIIGSSDLLLPSTNNDLEIQLDSPIAKEQTVVAVLHKDNGDGKFDSDMYLGNSNQTIVTDVDVVDTPKNEEGTLLKEQVEVFLQNNSETSTN